MFWPRQQGLPDESKRKERGLNMQFVNADNKIPIKSWCLDVESNAMEQASNLANLPFAYHHIALMPDCHSGYGMPIGGVMATTGVVVPNAVGVDIGCGMCAVRTSLTDIDTETLKLVMSDIRTAVPLGFNHHKEPQEWNGFDDAPDIAVIQTELKSSSYQIGTLGGGNHFIEIQGGSDGFVWLMIHSGSRNFGLKIAKEYHGKANDMCERWYSDIPDQDLSFLPIETFEAQEYLDAMNYALSFAKQSRHMMMDVCVDAMITHTGCAAQEWIDIHHNYAAWEHHFGKNVLIHRKGATLAREGGLGIIPGSQGTDSYIVRGLGNKESFESCSHGAGRRMGRKEAERTLDLQATIDELDRQGIVHSIRQQRDLDEAPGAYKDIIEVMASQIDLVEPVVTLRPLAVIKG